MSRLIRDGWHEPWPGVYLTESAPEWARARRVVFRGATSADLPRPAPHPGGPIEVPAKSRPAKVARPTITPTLFDIIEEAS